MSTSYFTQTQLDKQLEQLGLARIPIGDGGDWRIINSASSHVFQGSEDRCSDFVKGMLFAKGGTRAVF